MAEALFVKDDENDFCLKGSLQGVVEKGWNWHNVYQFVKDNDIVWTSPECCLVLSDTEHIYSVDMTVQFDGTGDEKKKQTLQISGSDAAATESTLNGLLRLCSIMPEGNIDVTLKCFPTDTRLPLATLQSLNATKGSNISCLRLHFVALDAPTVQMIMTSNIPSLELRQSTINATVEEGCSEPQALLGTRTRTTPTQGKDHQGPREMTISCSLPEFIKLVAGGIDENLTVQKLFFQLHFTVEGDPLQKFTNALQATKNTQGVETLTMEYLDISDDGWKSLCKALHRHPSLRAVHFGFTEKFVDTYRRLTPERRAARTQAVLELVRVNTKIQEFTCPACQQDESIQSQVEYCLKENNTREKRK
jgi:hypothetical protein